MDEQYTACTIFSSQRYYEREYLVSEEVDSESTWWREVQESRLKLCPTKYFIQKCKYHSIDSVIRLCIQLIFTELQVTRNKTMKKLQSQFSGPQSRMDELPLGSICVSIQKQEPPLLIPAWLVTWLLPLSQSMWIFMDLHSQLLLFNGTLLALTTSVPGIIRTLSLSTIG